MTPMFTGPVAGESVAARPGMRALLVSALAFVAVVTTAVRASAVTLDQVVALARAGVSESVILAVIDRDKTIFDIAPDQVVTLKQQGLSDALILALLRSGRPEGDQAAQSEAAARAAASSEPVAPDVAIVGHGPDIPNVTHVGYPFYPGYDYPGFYPGFDYPAPFPAMAPPVIPFPVPFGPVASGAPRAATLHARAMCLSQTTGGRRGGGPALSTVTACPPALRGRVNRAIR